MDKERFLAFQYWPHVITITLMVAAYIGYWYFAYYDTRSDDSYVSANVINIASLVNGPISQIFITENQQVKQGDKLIEIDPRPFAYAMHKAKADYHLSQVRYNNNKLAIRVAQEKLKQSQARLALSQDHFKRYQTLQNEGALAKIQLINIESKIQEQQDVVIAAQEQLNIARQLLDDSEMLAAKAVYDKTVYLYNHTLLKAPADGFVTNFNLRRGQYIAVGEGLFALIETKHWWVVTRYRETAIRLIKPGDKAKIILDMYPGKTFHGHVGSIGWGINRVQSGAVAPSTLAYLEATEDWIKIAQRFPVRIYIDDVDPNYPLRIGASATTVTYR